MFAWLRKKSPAGPGSDLRELLFGDVPGGKWAANGEGEPWTSFRTAHAALARGDRAAAQRAFEAVLTQPDLESRQYLQAWSGLRALGVTPPQREGKRVFGVVLDVPVNGGLDTLAAYEDRSARYLNYSGAIIVWEAAGSDSEVDARIHAVLAAGQTIANAIGPFEGERPPVPRGQARVSILTPSGLHFGQALLQVLSREPLAAPVFQAGQALMTALMERTRKDGGRSSGAIHGEH